MKESVEMQNEFEEIIQELNKLKSTNESLLKFEELIGTTAKKFNEVNQSAVLLLHQTQVLIERIDKFIEKYQSILDEQIDDLKREIRDLKKLLKELDIDGIVTSAKTELIDSLNAKTETLLEKLGGMSTLVQNLAEKTDEIQKICTKEFQVLSQKMETEAAKITKDFIVPLKKDVELVVGHFETINFPAQFQKLNNGLEEINTGIAYLQKETNIHHQQSLSVLGKVETIESKQKESRQLLETMSQRILGLEGQNKNLLSKMESNTKTHRLQFIILIAVIIISWMVLMFK